MDNLNTTESKFTPPRHWIGPEELDASYWNDPATREKRGQEFHDKPLETLEMIERMDSQGIARRDFLTIMGASMALAGFGCARRPVHKIIPYVVKPEEITPGVANWYASTNPETGEGILIKNREGRPIKLEGNPDHPLSRGSLCARTQASILSLYDPERLRDPVAYRWRGRTGRTVAWSEVDAAVTAKFKGAGTVRVLSAPVRGDSSYRLASEFLAGFGSGGLVEYDALAMDEAVDGQEACYGTRAAPRFHFEKAEMVVSLGADFLGTWDGSTAYAADWIKTRKLDGQAPGHAKMSKLVAFESTMTVTGTSADRRFPVRPGDELKVALAIAHELIVTKKESKFAGDAAVAAALAGYQPETVAAEIGLNGGAEALRAVAHQLWAARGRSLVVAGGIASKTEHAVATQIAVNLLNSALENEGVTVTAGTASVSGKGDGFAGVAKLIGEMKAGQVDVLVIDGVNPVYTLPKSAGFEEALKSVKFVVTLDTHETETAKVSDFALPKHHFLESWGDFRVARGVLSLQQPAIAPIHHSRASEDCFLAWGKQPERKWHDYLKSNWKENLAREVGGTGDFEGFWENSLRAGLAAAGSASTAVASARAFRSGVVAQLPKYSPASGELFLALYAKVSLHDGRSANNAWLQELPDPVTKITWDNYLNVSPALAKKLDLKSNDVVELIAAGVKTELPVNVQPGMHPAAVSAAVGYGRRAAGKIGTGAGVDVYPFVRATKDGLAFSGRMVTIRKTGKFYALANTQWHNVTENRPVVNDISLAEYRSNPGVSNHTDPHLRMETVPTMWTKHEYKGHRWGMAIDLTSCTGCSACVIACQAENNIPVVGRDQVRVSRQMHWIRIDRYYSGTPENPETVYQPMLCQHCENAPCETVCPVLATVHSDEGLNEQVYNRCVGTRYCQNNCPYKVRRFNFFDHWEAYESTMNMVWNPDITVRTRGIMEKCSFCVQRIKEAREEAKIAGGKIKDGDIVTACQQTCPTSAIAFGDVNDPNSRVAKLRAEQRGFRVLEVLNAVPMITYMTKIRNAEGKSGHGGAGAHQS